jgi:hypothetical protein
VLYHYAIAAGFSQYLQIKVCLHYGKNYLKRAEYFLCSLKSTSLVQFSPISFLPWVCLGQLMKVIDIYYIMANMQIPLKETKTRNYPNFMQFYNISRHFMPV